MQFRQLRYFVKIVEAGSFSRAATTIHVAQPALSQQIADLEARLGISLLQRSARGVRPTAAGEVLYREASAIIKQVELLPGIIKSSSGEPEGTVSLGIAGSLAPKVVGGILEESRTALPKITLKFSDGDSGSLESKVSSNTLDLAIVYEDELVSTFFRKPLFRQKLYLVSGKPLAGKKAVISLRDVADLPLVLPGKSNARRDLIDRTFLGNSLNMKLALEADSLTSEMWAVRTNVGHTILPLGDMSHFGPGAFAQPILIEPAIYLTCSIISLGDFPLTNAGEAVRNCLFTFIKTRLKQADMPGTEWIGK